MLAIVLLGMASKPIIALWVGQELEVSSALVISMGLLVLVSTWNNVFGSILGGIGKIRLGSIYTIFTALLNIPLSYFMAVKLGLGIPGIVLGTVTSISISAILSPLQVYFFIYARPHKSALYWILR